MLAKANSCRVSHARLRIGWQSNPIDGPSWGSAEPPGVCVCGQLIAYDDLVLGWKDAFHD